MNQRVGVNRQNNQQDFTKIGWLLLVAAACMVMDASGKVPMGRHSNKSILQSSSLASNQRTGMAFHRRSSPLSQLGPMSIRGGSTLVDDEDEDEGEIEATHETTGNDSIGDEEDDDGDDDDDDDDDDDGDGEDSVAESLSKNVKLIVKTNWGSSLLDHRAEINAKPTRDIASLKKSISRQLPGRPPELAMQLVYEGRVLSDDEMLIYELFDDDEDDDEEDEDDEDLNSADDMPTKHLTLDIIPPVDPKFANEFAMRLKAESTSDDYLSTSDLLEAYYLNQVAMAHNSRLLIDPSAPVTATSSEESSSPMLRLEMQNQAKKLRDQLQREVDEKVWETSMTPIDSKSHQSEERRGQRYRSGKGGASTTLRQSIQYNMNIDWGTTIRNCILFLFFGYFGGRNSLSRSLMLWGAPMCFILQARPVKLLFKQGFFLLSDPPGMFLSLLPAPQQALLNFDMEKAYNALYQTEQEKAREAVETTFAAPDEEEQDDDEEEVVASDDENIDESSDDEEETDDEEEESDED